MPFDALVLLLTELAIKYGSAGGSEMLEATRTVGNIMEQVPTSCHFLSFSVMMSIPSRVPKSIPFLASLWLHAVLVNARTAAKVRVRRTFHSNRTHNLSNHFSLTIFYNSYRLCTTQLGWAWLAFCSLYPFVFGKIPNLFFSTFPRYLIVGKLVWPLAKLSRQ